MRFLSEAKTSKKMTKSSGNFNELIGKINSIKLGLLRCYLVIFCGPSSPEAKDGGGERGYDHRLKLPPLPVCSICLLF